MRPCLAQVRETCGSFGDVLMSEEGDGVESVNASCVGTAITLVSFPTSGPIFAARCADLLGDCSLYVESGGDAPGGISMFASLVPTPIAPYFMRYWHSAAIRFER